jgi:hypothetical protein
MIEKLTKKYGGLHSIPSKIAACVSTLLLKLALFVEDDSEFSFQDTPANDNSQSRSILTQDNSTLSTTS